MNFKADKIFTDDENGLLIIVFFGKTQNKETHSKQ